MKQAPLRIGVIGAGGIVRDRHSPNLSRLIHRVENVVVANRSLDSSRAAAERFGFRQAADHWRQVVEHPEVDAVLIGTWPCLHAEASIAALDAGKHVFCQARMAMDLTEARAMALAAGAHPRQVAMLCPPPHRMPLEPVLRGNIGSGELGELAAVELTSVNDASLLSPVIH